MFTPPRNCACACDIKRNAELLTLYLCAVKQMAVSALLIGQVLFYHHFGDVSDAARGFVRPFIFFNYAD